MRQILHLHPHKHTGKLLHHRHTSYPALLLIVALTGLILMAPAGLARAADYKVTAIVPAPLPAGPAVITHPAANGIIYSSTSAVSGTCPVITPAIIVVLYEGTQVLGSQTCTANGTFSMPIGFSVGTHTIYAQIMNFTGQTGASSVPITFRYPLPGTVTSNGNPAEGTAPPLEIISQAPFIVFGTSKDAVWDVTIQGGVTPYTAIIHWSDGTVQTIRNLGAGDHSFSHHYTVMRSYKVTIDVRDKFGVSANRGISAVTPSTFSAYPTISTERPSFTWILYVVYGLLVTWLLYMWHRQQLAYHQFVPVPVTKRRKPQRASSQARKRK